MVELVNFIMKHNKDVTRRVAGLKLRCEGMCKKISLCPSLIGFQGSDEDGTKF